MGQLKLISPATESDLLAWAKTVLSQKNSLQQSHARELEAAYQERLERLSHAGHTQPAPQQELIEPNAQDVEEAIDLAFPKEPARKRSKEHLSFVRSQSCLICKQAPSDAHHLKFAQPRSLGRKVSDEYTVPLCRLHHQDLHRHGNEQAWWANMQIAPLPIAKELWSSTLLRLAATHSSTEPAIATNSGASVG